MSKKHFFLTEKNFFPESPPPLPSHFDDGVWKIFFVILLVKITKARSIWEQHDHFVLHQFFAEPVACDEAQKKRRFSRKKEKKSK